MRHSCFQREFSGVFIGSFRFCPSLPWALRTLARRVDGRIATQPRSPPGSCHHARECHVGRCLCFPGQGAGSGLGARARRVKGCPYFRRDRRLVPIRRHSLETEACSVRSRRARPTKSAYAIAASGVDECEEAIASAAFCGDDVDKASVKSAASGKNDGACAALSALLAKKCAQQ